MTLEPEGEAQSQPHPGTARCLLVRDADRTNNASQLGVTYEKARDDGFLGNDVCRAAGIRRQRGQAMWKKADANNDGVLSEQESLQYSAMMRVHDKTLPPDGKLTQAAFMEACKADVYTPRKNDAGAPLKGANSFTEGQAKDRAMAAGFTSVSSMKKDGDGIWRGTAMQDGKSIPVAVDFKGNVVATSPNAN